MSGRRRAGVMVKPNAAAGTTAPQFMPITIAGEHRRRGHASGWKKEIADPAVSELTAAPAAGRTEDRRKPACPDGLGRTGLGGAIVDALRVTR